MTFRKDQKEYNQESKSCCVQKNKTPINNSGVDHCNVHVHVKYVDTINIYNCSASPKATEKEAPTEQTDYSDCIPFTEGHKPKQNLQSRLNKLFVTNKVPSVLAATFLHQAHRYLAGHEPKNELETSVFAIFKKLPTSTHKILKCVLQKLDSDLRMSQLLSKEIIQLWDVPITTKKLTSLVAKELVQRTSDYYFDEPDCFDSERPGLLRQRPQDPSDDVGSPLIINISVINGLRTNQYLPVLSLGEYQTKEIQQNCTAEIQDGTSVELNCTPQTENCLGNNVDGVCLRVPEVQPGESVLLQGFNYFSVDGKVRLTGKDPSSVMHEVDAFVCGDITTQLTEIINDVEHVIEDSRVRDKIFFTIPVDLPVGIYRIAVIMPLNGNDLTSQEQFIRVLSPNTTTYQVASEQLKAVNETSPSWFGSDEVGIKILSTAITQDGEVGAISSDDFKFGDVDSGDTRKMDRVIFQQDNIASIVITIIGHEIDNDELYEKEVESFEDAFVEVLESNWASISGALGTTGGAGAIALGLSTGWAAAIGGAITLAVNLLVAYFGRADLIIEDTIALSALDLDARTNANFPEPEPISYTSPGGIDVTAQALVKDIQYTEKREYISNDEGSKYRITLRYNRVL